MIRARLEGGWCISQPKRHDQKLIVSTVTPKSNLGDILLPHFYLMIAGVQVNLSEVHRPMELIQYLINPWDGVYIFYFLLI